MKYIIVILLCIGGFAMPGFEVYTNFYSYVFMAGIVLFLSFSLGANEYIRNRSMEQAFLAGMQTLGVLLKISYLVGILYAGILAIVKTFPVMEIIGPLVLFAIWAIASGVARLLWLGIAFIIWIVVNYGPYVLAVLSVLLILYVASVVLYEFGRYFFCKLLDKEFQSIFSR